MAIEFLDFQACAVHNAEPIIIPTLPPLLFYILSDRIERRWNSLAARVHVFERDERKPFFCAHLFSCAAVFSRPGVVKKALVFVFKNFLPALFTDLAWFIYPKHDHLPCHLHIFTGMSIFPDDSHLCMKVQCLEPPCLGIRKTHTNKSLKVACQAHHGIILYVCFVTPTRILKIPGKMWLDQHIVILARDCLSHSQNVWREREIRANEPEGVARGCKEGRKHVNNYA